MTFDLENDAGSSVYVGNIDEKVTDDLLRELFVQAGPISSVKIPMDNINQKRKPFAFVNFKHSVSGDYAIRLFHDTPVFGKNIFLRHAHKNASGGPSPSNSYQAAKQQLDALQQQASVQASVSRQASLNSMQSPSVLGAYTGQAYSQGIPYNQRHDVAQAVASPVLPRPMPSTPISVSTTSYAQQTSDGRLSSHFSNQPSAERHFHRDSSDHRSERRESGNYYDDQQTPDKYRNDRRDSTHRPEAADYRYERRDSVNYRQDIQDSAGHRYDRRESSGYRNETPESLPYQHDRRQSGNYSYNRRGSSDNRYDQRQASFERSSSYPQPKDYRDSYSGRPTQHDSYGPMRSRYGHGTDTSADHHASQNRHHPYSRPDTSHQPPPPSTYRQYSRR